jgi:hypothetical protein
MSLSNGLLAGLLPLVVVSCGGSLPAGPQPAPGVGNGLRLTASPEPVAAGTTLTYGVDPGPAAAGSQVVVHLPPGVAAAQPGGASWHCSQTVREADSFQSASHTDVECSSAAMGAAPALTIKVKAPAVAGTIRACAAARRLSSCATSTVAQ